MAGANTQSFTAQPVPTPIFEAKMSTFVSSANAKIKFHY